MIITKAELEKRVTAGLAKNNRSSVKIDLVSITLHLDGHFCTYDPSGSEPFTPPFEMGNTTIESSEFVLVPGGRVLACSQETIRMPLDLMGFIQTKGSLARGFLFAHACDGQVDPGYEGKLTFEIMNMSEFYYKLVPGMEFACLFIQQLDRTLSEGYSGRYQDSGAPTPMKKSK